MYYKMINGVFREMGCLLDYVISMIEENRSRISFYVFTETNVFTFLRQYSLDWCIFACHEKSQMPTFKLSNVVQRLATHQSHGKNLFIAVVSQHLEKEVVFFVKNSNGQGKVWYEIFHIFYYKFKGANHLCFFCYPFHG